MEDAKKIPGNEPSPSLKILLADDMPMNVELAVKLLTRRGHNVVAVGDGQQAVEQFKSEPFDVILMDVQMPVVDGLQATRMIRKHEAEQPAPSHIPIIAMTANDDPDDRRECKEAGMDGFITKPIDIKTIVATIREIIENISH